jgi:hypothetical protein
MIWPPSFEFNFTVRWAKLQDKQVFYIYYGKRHSVAGKVTEGKPVSTACRLIVREHGNGRLLRILRL